MGSGLSHFVIQVASVTATEELLGSRGVEVEAPRRPDAPDSVQTAWITDPDGNRIELVQWPPDHPDGMTASDRPA